MASARKTLLVTLRHPGPVDFVMAAIPKLSESLNIVILATDAAAYSLSQRYSEHLNQYTVRVIEICPRSDESVGHLATQLSLDDHEGMNVLLAELKRVATQIAPDIVLRTTPSHSIGIDELLPVALRSTGYCGPILCLQDYYGIGLALKHDEHPVANVGVDAVATIDESARRMLEARLGIRATVVGWVAHEEYLSGEPYRRVREEARDMLGLHDEKLILYAGICSNLPEENDVKDFGQMIRAVSLLSKRRDKIKFGYKLHPRVTKTEAELYDTIATQAAREIDLIDLRNFPSHRHYLAAPDLIVSAASAFNLEALAYGSVDRSANGNPDDATVSLYTTGAYAQAAMKQLTGISLLPTHEEHGGSLTSSYESLDALLEQGLFDSTLRARVLMIADRIYQPTGDAVPKLVDFILSLRELD